MPAINRLPLLNCLRVGIAGLGAVLAVLAFTASAQASTYRLPPTGQDQWYWEIAPSSPGLAGLPSPAAAAYPAPGSANIWDTDLFQDSNTDGGVPTGASPVVSALHAAGKYSICYVEAGAYQVGFPDDSNFATADYGGVGDTATQMQGYPDEFWFDLTGFKDYVAGNPNTLTGAAANIAAGLNQRFAECKLEGQDAVEPDDLDGYTNQAQSGVTPWGMNQADSAGFERWLAYDIHANGLAAFQKNDPANAAVDEPLFDGMIIEQCNAENDPCAGSGGDATPYLNAGKPVLNAEYTEDGESTGSFCSNDVAAGITGALFNVDLNGATYEPCAPVGNVRPGGIGGTGGAAGSGSAVAGAVVTGTGRGKKRRTGRGTPVNTKAPVLIGALRRGARLKVSKGSWAGSPTKFSYAWKRCAKACTVIKGANRRTYAIRARDVGYRLIAVVRAKNAHGWASAVTARSRRVASRSEAAVQRRDRRSHRHASHVKKKKKKVDKHRATHKHRAGGKR